MEALTRQEILSRYSLQTLTLDWLTAGHSDPLIEGEFSSKHGRSTLGITPQNDYVFRCAALDVASFGTNGCTNVDRGVRPLPFHRFLLLRFLTISLEALFEEIFQIGLLEKGTSFTLSALKKAHTRFLKLCPVEMRSFAEKRLPPDDSHASKYQTMLRTWGIDLFYEQPETVTDLCAFMSFRARFETLLTTQALCGELAEHLDRALNLKTDAEAVNAYRRLFYDVHSLRAHEFTVYLSLLCDSERKAKKSAVGKTLASTVMSQGDIEHLDKVQVLNEIYKNSLANFVRVSFLRSPHAVQMARGALDPALKIHEYLSRGEPTPSTAVAYERMQLKEAVTDPKIIRVDNILPKAAKNADAS